MGFLGFGIKAWAGALILNGGPAVRCAGEEGGKKRLRR